MDKTLYTLDISSYVDRLKAWKAVRFLCNTIYITYMYNPRSLVYDIQESNSVQRISSQYRLSIGHIPCRVVMRATPWDGENSQHSQLPCCSHVLMQSCIATL